jgi:tetratricopeptide (TPR) repeat protein
VDPGSIDALINTGAIAHRYRDYSRAVAAYGKVLKLQPQNAIALKGLAFAYYGSGEVDRAIEYFTKVSQADPKDLNVLFNLGECYYTYKHDYPEALKYYRVYKVKMGSALQTSDPVNDRIQAAETKMQMAEQIKKEEEEARRKEEERKKALDKTKQERADDKAEGEKKLEDILKTQEGEEPPPTEGAEKKPEEGAPPAPGTEKKPEEKAKPEKKTEKQEEGRQEGKAEKAKEPAKEEKAPPEKEKAEPPKPQEEKGKPENDKPKPKDEASKEKEEKGGAK